MTEPMTELPGEALAALAEGRKIDAVRLVREHRGIGLKEANDLVKAYQRAHPGPRGEAIGPGGGSVIKWLVILGVLAFLAYWFLG